CADVINVFVSIDIPHPRAARAFDKKRLATDAAKGTDRRVHAAGDSSQRSLKKFVGFGSAHRIESRWSYGYVTARFGSRAHVRSETCATFEDVRAKPITGDLANRWMMKQGSLEDSSGPIAT